NDWPQAIWHADQPHGDASFVPMLALATHAKRHVKVVLTGEGADEIFGGYSWHASAPYRSDLPWLVVRERVEANSVFRREEKQNLYSRALRIATVETDAAEIVHRALDESPTN